MRTTLTNPKKKQILYWAVTIIATIFVMLIPTSEVFTPQLRTFFAITIFFIMLVCFSLCTTLLASMLLFSLYIVSGITDAATALSPWTNTIIYMVIGAFAISNVMDECGLLRRIAMWIILRCGGTYTSVLYGIYFISCVLALITFNNHFIVILAFTFGLVKAFDFEPFSKEAGLIMFVGAIGASAPGNAIYAPAAISMLENAVRLSVGDSFSMPWYLVTQVNWIFLLVPIVIIFIFSKLYNTRQYDSHINKAYFRNELQTMGKMSATEKKVCIILCILLLFLLLQPIHGLPIAWGFMTIPWLLWAPGINAGTDTAVQKIDFGMMAFMAACMSIGTVGMSLGVAQLITATLGTTLGSMSPFAFFAASLGFGAVANIVLTPFAIFSTLTVPLTQIGLTVGVNPAAVAMTILIASDIWFFTHETTALVIMYSFGMIKMTEFMKLAAIKSIVSIILFLVLLVPYWMLTGFAFI